MNEAKIICLTPVKNEVWILQRFLKSASLWADHIIIADQNSTDGSIEITQSFPKVTLIKNTSKTFNEPERQKMLIDEARKIPGKKILIALDADESLTADSVHNPEWEIIKTLEPGTVLKFDWMNVLPEKSAYWKTQFKMPFGFVDNGSDHQGKMIHSLRIPVPQDSPEYFPKHIEVMHFQYADWKRMESKHRWYQCWEHINDPKRSIIGMYRQYHHMYSIHMSQYKALPKEWFEKYMLHGIDYMSFKSDYSYYWDHEIINLFNTYGLKFFSKIDIWDVNWDTIAKNMHIHTISPLYDPRTRFEKILNVYLKKTQPYMGNIFLKTIDRLTRIFL